MKTIFFCMIMSLFVFPISGKTAVLNNNMALSVKSPNIKDQKNKIQFSENGKNEDDPSTDDGEDLRDGDSDSNSNDDSDKDNG